MIRARVITCSDSAANGTRADRAGPAVRELLAKHGYSVDAIVVVTDDVEVISEAIARAMSRRRRRCACATAWCRDSES